MDTKTDIRFFRQVPTVKKMICYKEECDHFALKKSNWFPDLKSLLHGKTSLLDLCR